MLTEKKTADTGSPERGLTVGYTLEAEGQAVKQNADKYDVIRVAKCA